MNEELDLWEYKGKKFPSKKELRNHFGFSSCKFDQKVKNNEIIKLKTTSTSYGNNI